jgi:hypothetical protein
MTNKNGATVSPIAPQSPLSVTTGKVQPMQDTTDPVVAGLSTDQLQQAADKFCEGIFDGTITFPEPEKSAEQLEREAFMNGVGYAGVDLQRTASLCRDAVDRETNPISLIEFDHDIEEAIEKLNDLRAHTVSRVNSLRNLPLSLVA